MADDHLLEVTALVEQLGIIQDHTKSMFAVPKTLTRHEAGLIEQSAQLIAGEHVAVASGRVKLSFTPSRPGPLPSFMADEFRVAYAQEQTVVRIGGRELDLGPSITYINRCSLVSAEDIVGQQVPEDGLTVQLELPAGEHVYRKLGALQVSDETTPG